jgi:DNA-directed RNA polymerase specialized sigma24 family protein
MRRPGIVTRSYAQAMARTAARPLPPLSVPAISPGRPSAEFGHHHDVAAPQVDDRAFRQGWRVQTRLDALLEAGKVDRDGWDAACLWRRWAERTAPLPAQAWDVRVDRSLVPNDTVALARVQAAAKLRAVVEALGAIRVKLLTMCVLEDRSWRDIAAAFRLSDKTVAQWTAEAVNALADHLAGRPIAPPPQLRPRVQPGRW